MIVKWLVVYLLLNMIIACSIFEPTSEECLVTETSQKGEIIGNNKYDFDSVGVKIGDTIYYIKPSPVAPNPFSNTATVITKISNIKNVRIYIYDDNGDKYYFVNGATENMSEINFVLQMPQEITGNCYKLYYEADYEYFDIGLNQTKTKTLTTNGDFKIFPNK